MKTTIYSNGIGLFYAVGLEVLAIALMASITRILLIEKDVHGAWRQFLGGIIFGALIGLLAFRYPERFYMGAFVKELWRLWTAVAGLFGKELLFFFKRVAANPPMLKKLFKNESTSEPHSDTN